MCRGGCYGRTVTGCNTKSLKTFELLQNAAAHVLTRSRKTDHVSTV